MFSLDPPDGGGVGPLDPSGDGDLGSLEPLAVSGVGSPVPVSEPVTAPLCPTMLSPNKPVRNPCIPPICRFCTCSLIPSESCVAFETMCRRHWVGEIMTCRYTAYGKLFDVSLSEVSMVDT